MPCDLCKKPAQLLLQCVDCGARIGPCCSKGRIAVLPLPRRRIWTWETQQARCLGLLHLGNRHHLYRDPLEINPKTVLDQILHLRYGSEFPDDQPWYHIVDALTDTDTNKSKAIQIMATLLPSRERKALMKAQRRSPPAHQDLNLVNRLPDELLLMIVVLLATDMHYYEQLCGLQSLGTICKTFYRILWSPEVLKARNEALMANHYLWRVRGKYEYLFRKRRRTMAQKDEDDKRSWHGKEVARRKSLRWFPNMEFDFPNLWTIVISKEASRFQVATAWQEMESHRLTKIHAMFLTIFGIADVEEALMLKRALFTPNRKFVRVRLVMPEQGPELRCTRCRGWIYVRRCNLEGDGIHRRNVDIMVGGTEVVCSDCWNDPGHHKRKRLNPIKPLARKRTFLGSPGSRNDTNLRPIRQFSQ